MFRDQQYLKTMTTKKIINELRTEMNLFFFLIFFLLYSDSFSQQIITVVAQPPEKITNDILKLPAKILANEKVQITSVVSEKIKKITFKEGKFVKKNQVLMNFLMMKNKQ